MPSILMRTPALESTDVAIEWTADSHPWKGNASAFAVKVQQVGFIFEDQLNSRYQLYHCIE
jgi:hypothetical protein